MAWFFLSILPLFAENKLWFVFHVRSGCAMWEKKWHSILCVVLHVSPLYCTVSSSYAVTDPAVSTPISSTVHKSQGILLSAELTQPYWLADRLVTMQPYLRRKDLLSSTYFDLPVCQWNILHDDSTPASLNLHPSLYVESAETRKHTNSIPVRETISL